MSGRVAVVGTVVLGVLAFACSGSAPTAPDVGTEAVLAQGDSGSFSASGGNSGCYAVKFNVAAQPIPETSRTSGVVTGDLVGTVEMEFDPNSNMWAGTTVANAGVGRWEITGGIIPGLGTFQTTFKNKNHLIDRPGSPAWVYENTGKDRASEGVAKANLTYKGTFIGIPPGFIDHDYKGVICP
jgi:hypothetical protein